MKIVKRLFLLAILLLISTLLGCYFAVEYAGKNRNYSKVANVPHQHVGLLLGCSAKLSNGQNNLFFIHRINAAFKLLQANKIDYLIISGDNSRKEYDETSDMKNALIQRGIPAERLISDYAGFRTLDSVIRAQKVFGATEILIISQAFHNKRALFIASHQGLSAVAFNAAEVNAYGSFKTKTREILARVNVVLDLYLLNTQPKFLGEPIPIPATIFPKKISPTEAKK